MLEFITEKCTDFLLRAIHQFYNISKLITPKTARHFTKNFLLLSQSLVPMSFRSSSPNSFVTGNKMGRSNRRKDIRNVKRFSNSHIKEIVKGGKRNGLPQRHYLKDYGIDTLPERITSIIKLIQWTP